MAARSRRALFAAVLGVAAILPFVAKSQAVTASWTLAGEPLLIGAEPWFAGAISSLRYRGVEYLDAADHGRLLSASISFDHWGECLNPTLGGSVTDGAKHETSSRLLSLTVNAREYSTATQMAYWMLPGALHHVDPASGATMPNRTLPCAPPPAPPSQRMAVNQTVLSDVIYAQKLSPGFAGIAHAVLDEVTFATASDHTAATVEAVTAYTPKRFDTYYLYDAAVRRFVRDDGVLQRPGEQARPVILATADGAHAIGVIALGGDAPPRYGRHIFPATNKWNLVFRPSGPYRAGTHSYRFVLVLGSLAEGEEAMIAVATL